MALYKKYDDDDDDDDYDDCYYYSRLRFVIPMTDTWRVKCCIIIIIIIITIFRSLFRL